MGAASACRCSLSSPGASAAPSAVMPGALAQRVSPCPLCPWRVTYICWGAQGGAQGGASSRITFQTREAPGLLSALTLPPLWEEGFSQQLAAVMSPASLGLLAMEPGCPAPCSVLPHTPSCPPPGAGPGILTLPPWQPPCLHHILFPSSLVLLCKYPSPTAVPRIPTQPESLGAGPTLC